MKLNVDRTVKNAAMLPDYQKAQAEYERISQQLQEKRSQCIQSYVKVNPRPDLNQYLNSCLGDMNKKLQDLQFEVMFYEIQVYGIENQDLQESRFEVTEGMEYYEAQGSLARFRSDAVAGRGETLVFTKSFLNFFLQSKKILINSITISKKNRI